VARFLIYAVDECGAPTRFKPPSKAKINELIGSSETTSEDFQPTRVSSGGYEKIAMLNQATRKPAVSG
jgi:hypothetical protein